MCTSRETEKGLKKIDATIAALMLRERKESDIIIDSLINFINFALFF